MYSNPVNTYSILFIFLLFLYAMVQSASVDILKHQQYLYGRVLAQWVIHVTLNHNNTTRLAHINNTAWFDIYLNTHLPIRHHVYCIDCQLPADTYLFMQT